LFDDYNLQLSRSVEDTINDYIDDFVTEYAEGSKSKLNAALGNYGINMKMLKKIYLRDEKTSALYDALYGSGGIIGLTDEDRADYLNENYVRVRHIYVNNAYTYSYDEDGMPEYTEEGLQKTRSLTAEELEAKQALIDAIDVSLAEGGDFEEIYEAFSEDQYYKNGYYISENMDFIDDVKESAFELEVGEYVKIESDYGTHYIMRLDMDDKPWESEDNKDFFEDYDTTVSEELFAEMVESRIDLVETDDEILSQYTMEESPINYRF
ncbi:MAG: peptidylprolyl isomerase, partial [Eubacteriales bacterium]